MCKKHYRAWLTKNPPMDAELVRRHINRLRADHAYGYVRIAELAGVGSSTVRDIAAGHRRYTYSDTAAAILAVNAENSVPAKMNPTGASRRVRALAALGYTQHQIAAEISVRQCNLWKYFEQTASWIRPETFDRIDAAFRHLATQPRPEGWVAERSRRRAAKRGWLPPLAWDEHSIDDPDAEPDWSAVPKAGGFKLAEFAVEYADLRDHLKLSDQLIAERLGIRYDTLLTRLGRLGIQTQNAMSA